jgi:hypothetical protein
MSVSRRLLFFALSLTFLMGISACIPRADPDVCTRDTIARPIPVSPTWDEITSTTPTLTWTYSDPDCPASFFEVIVGTTDIGVSEHIGSVQNTTGTSIVWPVALEPARTYWWIVIPVVATTDGEVKGVGFEAIMPFNTGPDCLGSEQMAPPLLLDPADGSTVTRIDGFGFIWDDPSACIPKLYQIELSLLEDFADPVVFIGERRTSLGIYSYGDFAFLDCTQYYWRVRALVMEITFGPYSDIWTFTTETGAMACPPAGAPTPAASAAPVASVLEAANCRSGPTMDYPVVRILQPGEQYPVVGRSQDGLAWVIGLVEIDDEVTWTPQEIRANGCWVHGGLVEVIGDTSLIAVIDPEPPTSSLPPTPTVNCAQYNTNQTACNNDPACTWDPNHSPNSPCVNK